MKIRPSHRPEAGNVVNATIADTGEPPSLPIRSLRNVAIDDNCLQSRTSGRPGRAVLKPPRFLSSISKPMSHYNQAAGMPGD
ncbi:hypothetical protein CO660_04525 [Rhizobium sp. L9]|nr:hypothetical protein CO660_04525 [Rhizobium sp. L9]